MKNLAILLVILGGCGASPSWHPAHAGMIVVEFDAHFDSAKLTDSAGGERSVSEALNAGLRYWDPVGVEFVSYERMTFLQWNIEVHVEHIKVRWADQNPGDVVGVYVGRSREITLYMDGFMDGQQRFPYSTSLLSSVLAHELGHAMGLQHVTDKDSVMYSKANADDGITGSDVAEFERVTR